MIYKEDKRENSDEQNKKLDVLNKYMQQQINTIYNINISQGQQKVIQLLSFDKIDTFFEIIYLKNQINMNKQAANPEKFYENER